METMKNAMNPAMPYAAAPPKLTMLCGLLLVLSLTPARAAAPDGERFVATFGEVCIPERLDYQGTVTLAERLGWQKIVPGADAEMDRFVDNARDQIEGKRCGRTVSREG